MSDSRWQTVYDEASRIWALANDGWDFNDDEAVKKHADKIRAIAAENGARTVSEPRPPSPPPWGDGPRPRQRGTPS